MNIDKKENNPSPQEEQKPQTDREVEIENGFFSIDDDENTKLHNTDTIEKTYSDTLGVPQENETDELANKAIKQKDA